MKISEHERMTTDKSPIALCVVLIIVVVRIRKIMKTQKKFFVSLVLLATQFAMEISSELSTV